METAQTSPAAHRATRWRLGTVERAGHPVRGVLSGLPHAVRLLPQPGHLAFSGGQMMTADSTRRTEASRAAASPPAANRWPSCLLTELFQKAKQRAQPAWTQAASFTMTKRKTSSRPFFAVHRSGAAGLQAQRRGGPQGPDRPAAGSGSGLRRCAGSPRSPMVARHVVVPGRTVRSTCTGCGPGCWAATLGT